MTRINRLFYNDGTRHVRTPRARRRATKLTQRTLRFELLSDRRMLNADWGTDADPSHDDTTPTICDDRSTKQTESLTFNIEGGTKGGPDGFNVTRYEDGDIAAVYSVPYGTDGEKHESKSDYGEKGGGIVIEPAPDLPPFNPWGDYIHVDDSNTGTQDGQSWLTAFSDLQDGLTAAKPGDVILVAGGIYNPGPYRSASFDVRDGVDMLGGFAGAFTGLGVNAYDRDWTYSDSDDEQSGDYKYRTILTGDIAGDDVYPLTLPNGNEQPVEEIDIANNGENNHNVLRAVGVQDATISGFYVQGGNADLRLGGGGMLNRYSTLTITDTVFRWNEGLNGGAMHNDQATPYLHEVIFDRNIATENGGALANINTAGDPQWTVNSVFYKNRAGESEAGGAIYDVGDTPTIVWNSTITSNLAYDGSGIYAENSRLLVVNSIVYGNYGDSQIAAIASNSAIFYSDIMGGWTGTGTGNLDVFPEFWAPDSAVGPDGAWATDDDGLQLNDYSLLLEQGSLSAPAIDVRGESRAPTEDGVDLGAYENQQADTALAFSSSTVNVPFAPAYGKVRIAHEDKLVDARRNADLLFAEVTEWRTLWDETGKDDSARCGFYDSQGDDEFTDTKLADGPDDTDDKGGWFGLDESLNRKVCE